MALQGQRRADDPSVSDFHHDMNEHGEAEYKKVGGDTVAELDSTPGGWQVTLWRAVSHPTRKGYAPPQNSENRYAWDARARAEFEDRADAKAAYSELSGEGDAEEFAKQHPYEGPLSPYSERVADEPRD